MKEHLKVRKNAKNKNSGASQQAMTFRLKFFSFGNFLILIKGNFGIWSQQRRTYSQILLNTKITLKLNRQNNPNIM